MVQPKSVILTGPTASGKTAHAIQLALELKKHGVMLEIINADSVCFYREFNIGSAKPTADEVQRVPHHLIDIASPDENYHAGQFLKDCEQILNAIHARGHRAIIVGGSGFYLKALRMGLWEAPETNEAFRSNLESVPTHDLFQKLTSLDPHHAQKIGPHDRYRVIRALEIIEVGNGKTPSELESEMPDEPDARFELWVMDRKKDELETRIRERIKLMLERGWISETELLRKLHPHSKTLQAVGYRQIMEHLQDIQPQGRIKKPGMEGLMDEIALAHRQLAKSQRTWFKNLNPNESFELDKDLQNLQVKLMNFYQK